MSKFHIITRLHKDDLEGRFTLKQIKSLSEFDISRIADKMKDAYLEGSYWIDLDIITNIILEEKKEKK